MVTRPKLTVPFQIAWAMLAKQGSYQAPHLDRGAGCTYQPQARSLHLFFSEVLGSMVADAGGWNVTVPDDWMQGRSTFGGLQAALALRAMRSLAPLVPADAPLRVLQVTFIGPVANAVRLTARVLRSGKSATFAEARIEDGGSTAALVVGVFGLPRPSRVRVIPEQPPVVSTDPIDFVYAEGFPKFTQHFPRRQLRGGLPFTGSKSRETVLEAGLNDPAKTSEEHVVAMADLPAPVALSLLRTVGVGSSMTWTLELLRDRFDDLPLQGWRLDAELLAGRDGYTSQSVMVWGPGGEPVALSRQQMVVFG
jgi:hypothetical protein